MKKLFFFLFLFALPLTAQQMVPITGTVNAVNGVQAGPNNYLEFALVNCGSQQPTVNGVAVMLNAPIDFYQGTGGILQNADGTPAQLYGNDVISCGTIGNTSRYSITQFVNGSPAGPTKYYFIQSGITFNLNTSQPVFVLPPLKYPNPSICPPGTTQNGLNNDLSSKCINLPGAASNAVVTNPAGTQIVHQPTGTFAQLDGQTYVGNNVTNGPSIDPTYITYGADNTGTNETSAQINAAINAALARKGANGIPPEVHLSAGTYKISSPIILPQCVQLSGDGANQTAIQLMDGSESGIIIMPGSTGGQGFCKTRVTGLRINGDGVFTTGTMIEDFTLEAQIDHVHLFNHGGRGIVLGDNDERGSLSYSSLEAIRWPYLNIGSNEFHLGPNVEIMTPGLNNNSGFPAGHYCWNVNCTNGIEPTDGNWVVDHHYAVFNWTADNISFEKMSIKSLAWMSGICFNSRNAEVKLSYLEAGFLSSPSINTAIASVCQLFDDFIGAAPIISGGNIQLTSASLLWMPMYTNEASTVSQFGKTMTFRIMCGDAAPGSTQACANDPAHQQGQFEIFSVNVFTPDGIAHGVTRCLSGSTVSCGSSGANWAMGWKIHQLAPASNAGIGLLVQNNHINVTSQQVFTQTINGVVHTLNGQCSDTTNGSVCAEITGGLEPDGLEVTAPGVTPVGFGGAFGFAGRSVIRLGLNDFSGSCTSNEPAGCGWIKVPIGSDVHCEQPNQGLNQSSQFSSITTDPRLQLGLNEGCNYAFVNYGGGHVAWGTLSAPGFRVQTTAVTPNGGWYAPVVSPDASDPSGLAYFDNYCFYDTVTSGHPSSRFCMGGGPDSSTSIFRHDTWNGSSWITIYSEDSVKGITSSPLPSSGVQIGQSANWVQNPINMTATGWSGGGLAGLAITCGQADPDGHNNACHVTVGAQTSTSFISNSATGTLPLGLATGCLTVKGDAGAEVLFFEPGQLSGNSLPSTQLGGASGLTNGFVRYCVSGNNTSTGRTLRLGIPSGTAAEGFTIYAPQVQAGSTVGPLLITNTSSVITPIPTVNAAAVSVGGNPTLACTGNAVSGTYCDGGSKAWTALPSVAAAPVHGKLTGGCTTGSSSFAACSNTVAWIGAPLASTPSSVACSGVNGNDPRAALQIVSYNTSGVSVSTITNGSTAVSFGEIDCIGTP